MLERKELLLSAFASLLALLAWRRARRKSGSDAEAGMEVPVAELPSWPLIGMLPSILKYGKDSLNFGVARAAVLGNKKGHPAVRVPAFGIDQVVVLDPDLVAEVFQHNFQAGGHFGKEFDSFPSWDLIADSFGHGLFTSSDHNPNWGLAHRMLIKPFSRQGMMAYAPLMNEQADLLVEALEREVGLGGVGRLYEYTVKMAVETICTCAMGTSFGSFTNKKPHKFMQALNDFFKNMMSIATLPSFVWFMFPKTLAKMKEEQVTMKEVVEDIIRKRRNKESESASKFPDILDCMVNQADDETGQKMDDDTIRFNIMTFLLAGQDSTAAAMSTFFCFLAGYPAVEEKLIEEIRRVVGNGDVTWKHISQMHYLDWTQKETLRLVPPVAAITKTVFEDTLLAGKWRVKKGTAISVIPLQLHLDPEIWGPDANKFVPERWEKGPPHNYAYLPFSHGPRGCIGKEFTLLEQKICIVKVLQRFILRRPADAHKPLKGNFLLRRSQPFPVCTPDFGMDVEFNPLQAFSGASCWLELIQRPMLEKKEAIVSDQTSSADSIAFHLAAGTPTHRTPLLILYGSDGGSTITLAEQVFETATLLGFTPRLATLDDLARAPEFQKGDTTVLILTATYNGQPPTNANNFVAWLNDAKRKQEHISNSLRFAVFGCGNSQWELSFQAMPTLVDERLAELGGTRLLPLHSADGNGDPEADFAAWHNHIWPALGAACGVPIEAGQAKVPQLKLPAAVLRPAGSSIQPVTMNFEDERGWSEAKVSVNKELQKPDAGSSTRHLEFEFQGTVMAYEAGDHVAVYPENSPELVKKLLGRMGLPLGAAVSMEEDASPAPSLRRSTSKTGECMSGKSASTGNSLQEVLLRTVDLAKPISMTALQYLVSKTSNPLEQAQLKAFDAAVIQQTKITPLELLLKFPDVKLNVSELLAILPAMKARYYSISSAQCATPKRFSITVGVVDGMSPTGRHHEGVCSNYLKRAAVGSKVWVHIKDMGSSFKLPSPGTPLVMIGPGTGLAPFRGFIQQLRGRQAQGAKECAAHLFFGCQSPDKYLYQEELQAYEKDGTLASLHVAFSRTGAREYVQAHIAKNAGLIWQVLRSGGHIYVCGDASKMAPSVRKSIKQAVSDAGGLDSSKASSFVDQLCASGNDRRYHEDIWAGNA